MTEVEQSKIPDKRKKYIRKTEIMMKKDEHHITVNFFAPAEEKMYARPLLFAAGKTAMESALKSLDRTKMLAGGKKSASRYDSPES